MRDGQRFAIGAEGAAVEVADRAGHGDLFRAHVQDDQLAMAAGREELAIRRKGKRDRPSGHKLSPVERIDRITRNEVKRQGNIEALDVAVGVDPDDLGAVGRDRDLVGALFVAELDGSGLETVW